MVQRRSLLPHVEEAGLESERNEGQAERNGLREADISQAPLVELTQRPGSPPAAPWLGLHHFKEFPFLLNFSQAGVGTGCGGGVLAAGHGQLCGLEGRAVLENQLLFLYWFRTLGIGGGNISPETHPAPVEKH